MTSLYFVKFSEIFIRFQSEITFDVKNYFLLLLRFLKENLLEMSNKLQLFPNCFILKVLLIRQNRKIFVII